MQAATDTELIEFKGWTLRLRPADSSSARLLVLIHGWTGDENSMWVFARTLAPDYWIIAPRGPHPSDTTGYSWRPPRAAPEGRPTLEMLSPAAESLMKLIDEYSASIKLDARQFDLMGFSQGAAMVNVIGMLFPERVRKMAVLAGFVPSGMDELIARQPLAGKHVFVAHGTQDQLVPVDRARASIKLLERAGAQVTYCEDEVGHKLSGNCLRALERYLKD